MILKKPDISIVIVNYNTYDLTSDCIRSVYEKTKGVSYEVILVDNASAERDPVDFKSQFPDITLIRNSQNLGFAKGNNIGINHASGQYILLLNSDTELKNDAVTIVHSFLQQNSRVAVGTCRLEFPDGKLQNNCQRFPSIGPKLFELMRLQKILPNSVSGKILFGPFFNHDEIAYPDWVWGTFFMFKKELLQKLVDKKLSDEFFMYVEDVEWCLQFKKSGYRIAFIPQGKVIHYLGKSGGEKNIQMEKNVRILYVKYYSVLQVWIISMLDRLLLRRT
jgi:GT2 family glycosyltransferase